MKNLAHANFNFMGHRKIWAAFSLLVTVLSIVSLSTRGLAFGLDFTGGSLVEVQYAQAPALNEVRNTLESVGFEGVVVQNFGSETDVLVRLSEQFDDELVNEVVSSLRADGSELTLQRAEFVGSQVGEELREQGGLGLLLALIVVLGYVAFRFQFKFGVASVLPLAHDVIVTLGIFSFFQLDFDLTVLAAVLAVIGYSINDTIVVADRIRENFRRLRIESPVEIINLSINQTLARTLVTSGTTLLTLVCLFIFGGEMIHNFALALIVGIVVGTYSSIYVAASLLLTMNITREDMALPVKEGAKGEAEEAPPEWLDRM
ncbi:MAG: protein translocase subunit SecF [Alteromonadaceae bacterium]|nr:protein translocase subunit SecF [Alteromonadaceae bacterium]|tara:strand:- start:3067 stop:4017 length:951 start_codon:yes stop_codon:yes gene_type:complete